MVPLPAAGQGAFGFQDVRNEAERLAAGPYRRPAAEARRALLKLNYKQYQSIRHRKEKAVLAATPGLFRVELFPTGFIYDAPVSMHLVDERGVTPIVGAPDMFDFSDAALAAPPDEVGLAGFRVLFPLHGPKLDEIAAFLGASYFRLIGREQSYGASVRGLAIDTGLPQREEFPAFTAFWLVSPAATARELTVFALLESPGATGAFSFTIRPGRRTTVDVSASLFLRHDVSLLGLSPLTSMFLSGKAGRRRDPDFRPEVHDSDGLLVASGSGEWIWRPLSNPAALAVSSLVDKNPRGFGLLQRERGFASYLDLEANYHTRPSLWVEPLGDWGEGEIRLIEIPTDSEVHDNVVAFWTPRAPTRRGGRVDLRYRVGAMVDEAALSPGARVVGTRLSAVADSPKLTRIVVEYAGGDLATLRPGQPVEAEVTASTGRIARSRIEAVAEQRIWRLFVDVLPDGRRPVDLRAFLSLRGEVLTETWSYVLRP